MTRLRDILLIALIAAAVAAPRAALAVTSETQSFSAPAAPALPTSYYDRSAPAWSSSLEADHFMDLTRRSEEVAHETVGHLVLDHRAIYVSFTCRQHAPITATQEANDVGFGIDDFVGIGIDTSGNGSQVYYFEATPRAVRYQQASESSRYAPQWQARASVTESGWNALLAIPLSTLRTRAGASQTWRINLVRHVAATDENSSWAFGSLMQDAAVPNWPGFADSRYWPALLHVAVETPRARPSGDVYLLGSAGEDRNLFTAGGAGLGRVTSRDIGADFKYPLTTSLNLVGTLAPDFSSVEADQTTIAPQEFRRVLTEYRPFFAQGARFIDPSDGRFGLGGPPYLLLYTPAIGIVNSGLKLEGTQGQGTIGVFTVQGPGYRDEAFGIKEARPDRSFSLWSDGVFADHEGVANRAIELGARHANAHSGFNSAVEVAEERGDGEPGAHAANAYVDLHKSNYEINLNAVDISRGFAPADGYVPVDDIHGLGAVIDLPEVAQRGMVKTYELTLGGDRYLDGAGQVHQVDAAANVDMVLRNGFHLSGGPQNGLLRIYGDVVSRLSSALQRFDQTTVNLGYGDGGPSPTDLSYAWGPFSCGMPNCGNRTSFGLNQYGLRATRQLARQYTISVEYDGTRERFAEGADGQILTRIAIGKSFDAASTFSVAIRNVRGTGGFAIPGLNTSAIFHRRAGGRELYVEYGAPSALSTVQRVVVKYALLIGGGI
jgi:hypothetical protein